MSDQFDAPVGGQFIDETYGPVETSTTTPTVTYINEAGVPDDVISQLRGNREIASQIERWSQSLSNGAGNTPTLDVFNRSKGFQAHDPFSVMAQCAFAVENDDILSTLSDVVEGLAFTGCRFEAFDDDQEDVWNQWAAEVDLDSRLREMFRELYKVSQFYVGLWWERRTYTVRDNPMQQTIEDIRRDAERRASQALGSAPAPAGPGRGNRRRRKQFDLDVPTAITVFDPTKILPVGTLMFGRERFAYIATQAEHDAFIAVLSGDVVDGTVLQLIESYYVPTGQDVDACGELGVDPKRLWLLREDAVFRHTLTRAQYERFAAIRLRSVLPLLEMKDHLRGSDRASLIGNTNFIVVVTKGSDRLPAKAAEIENLKEQARTIARLPVLVGDHRLHVEIVSPALDNTLAASRWDVLDSRLVFRALATFQPAQGGGGAASSGRGGGVSEMSRVVSKGLENRRHMMIRSLEAAIFKRIADRNPDLTEKPSLAFVPKRITLDFSADIMTAVLKLRDRGDISRESALEELDFDQDVEVLRRARERAIYDETFSSSTPYSSPAANPFSPQAGAPAIAAPDVNSPDAGRPRGITETQPRGETP